MLAWTHYQIMTCSFQVIHNVLIHNIRKQISRSKLKVKSNYSYGTPYCR